MQNRSRLLFPALMYSAVLISFGAQSQTPQPYSSAQTYYGQPAIQGTWETRFVTMLERPDNVASLIVDAEQASRIAAGIVSFIPHNEDPDFEWQDYTRMQLAVVKGEFRSSLIVDPPDGKIPYLESVLPQVEYNLARYEVEFDHPEQRPLGERCLVGFSGPPIFAIPLMFPYQIVQTRDHIILAGESSGGPRVIHLTGNRERDIPLTFEGYSTGVWEDNTLVVTTTHIRPDHGIRSGFGRPLLVSPETRIEERFTRVSETELNYYFTVTDQTLYSRPWAGEFSLYAHDGPLYEYACHEGNYSLPGILLGGQRQALEAQSAQ